MASPPREQGAPPAAAVAGSRSKPGTPVPASGPPCDLRLRGSRRRRPLRDGGRARTASSRMTVVCSKRFVSLISPDSSRQVLFGFDDQADDKLLGGHIRNRALRHRAFPRRSSPSASTRSPCPRARRTGPNPPDDVPLLSPAYSESGGHGGSGPRRRTRTRPRPTHRCASSAARRGRTGARFRASPRRRSTRWACRRRGKGRARSSGRSLSPDAVRTSR